VGRVTPEKGLRTLCQAAQRTGVAVKVAGDGPQLHELKAEFGALPNIEFLGRVEPQRTQQMMREALAVLVPSEWYENQPMVILEAFANGTPVIASAIGGSSELVTEGATGLLHPPGDAEALAARMVWACGHRDEMATMGDEARRFAAAFGPQVYYQRLMSIYERVLASAPAAVASGPAAVAGRPR
jgi:glycosyltransferase involved in cell wall biosynthesis